MECRSCGGLGHILQDDGSDSLGTEIDCEFCDGSGAINSQIEECDHDWEDMGEYQQCTYPDCQQIEKRITDLHPGKANSVTT